MRPRIVVILIAVSLIACCAVAAWRLRPFLDDIDRAEAPLLWWTTMILCVVVLKLLLTRTAVATKRLAFGQCLSCGSLLAADKPENCPKCGKPTGISRTNI